MHIRFYQSMVILLGSTTSILLGTVLGTAAQAAPESNPNEAVVSTSARDLILSTSANGANSTNSIDAADAVSLREDRVAQAVTPGRATRSGPSYVGVGGNLGFGGDTALGETNFTIFSKIGLTRNFSARPGVVVGSDPTILLPLTADLPIGPIAEDVDFAVAPFVGGGLAISTGSESLARPLITGGIDIPVADRVTVVAQGNVAFFRNTEGSIILGVGYNF